MKAKTIEQYKIIQYLEENFTMDFITLELIDRYTVLVEDRTGAKLYFKYKDNKVIFEEV